MKRIFGFIQKISLEFDTWQIALRTTKNTPLYKGNAKDFFLVSNSIRYWRADPFVYKHEGKNYLFAEMYDRKKKKGVIGVAKVVGNRCSKFKVCLELPYHLSYPCIFEKKDQIYMIPECNESAEVSIYRSVKFPYKWEKVEVIHKMKAVDTTPFFNEQRDVVFYFTSLYEPILGGNDNLHCLDKNKQINELYLEKTDVRCAGHIIYSDKILRPAQEDTLGYGDALIFKEIDNSNCYEYREHEYLKVLPPNSVCGNNEIAISLLGNNISCEYTGVHTYNCNEDYEVVDLKIKSQYNLYTFWDNRKKLTQKIMKRMKVR